MLNLWKPIQRFSGFYLQMERRTEGRAVLKGDPLEHEGAKKRSGVTYELHMILRRNRINRLVFIMDI